MSIGWPETFALDLDLVQKALALNAEEPGISIEHASEVLGIGKPKVRGVNAWMKYLGLRDPKQRKLTSLGNILNEEDPLLEDGGTHAVFHYHLASNVEATVWHEAINHFLQKRRAFTRNELRDHFVNSGISEDTKHLNSDIGLFIRMYTNDHRRSLQSLKFLERENEVVHARSLRHVASCVVAYCMFEFRERGHMESTTAVSRLLEEPGRPGRVFSLNESALRDKLSAIELEGYTTVVRSADIDGVAYTSSNAAIDILRDYYRLRA